jgi:anti-sigma regulatory factor (Ser/Thr protein kinase)
MTATQPDVAIPGFLHMIYPYAGEHEYLNGTLAYIEHARAAGGNVIVAAPPARREALGAQLGSDAGVTFVDTDALGRNPGRLIPAWRDWIGHLARTGAVHGINESVFNGHSPAHHGELRYQEWLLNLAFAQTPALALMCPVDTGGQEKAAIEALTRCHPLLWNGAACVPGVTYREDEYDFEPLPEPEQPAEQMAYDLGSLHEAREKTLGWALGNGMPLVRAREFTLAVSEIASNSVVHGGGRGTLRMWRQASALVCEMADAGVITDPMAGRIRPRDDQLGGRGLWFVNQLCDLVQIRSAPGQGTRIRLWMDLVSEGA